MTKASDPNRMRCLATKAISWKSKNDRYAREAELGDHTVTSYFSKQHSYPEHIIQAYAFERRLFVDESKKQ